LTDLEEATALDVVDVVLHGELRVERHAKVEHVKGDSGSADKQRQTTN